MKKINPVEKFLRSNPRIASIIYFSTLGYLGFNIYSDIILSESNNSSNSCLLYTSPSPRDRQKSRMPSSA